MSRRAVEIFDFDLRALVRQRDAEREIAIFRHDFGNASAALFDRVVARRLLFRTRVRNECGLALDRLRAIRATNGSRRLKAANPCLKIRREFLTAVESITKSHRVHSTPFFLGREPNQLNSADKARG
jgi:hypothetical protein